MAKIYDLPLQLPSRYYAPIGEVIYRWALLEFQMQAIIWRAMGIDNPQGRTLTIEWTLAYLLVFSEHSHGDGPSIRQRPKR